MSVLSGHVFRINNRGRRIRAQNDRENVAARVHREHPRNFEITWRRKKHQRSGPDAFALSFGRAIIHGTLRDNAA